MCKCSTLSPSAVSGLLMLLKASKFTISLILSSLLDDPVVQEQIIQHEGILHP